VIPLVLGATACGDETSSDKTTTTASGGSSSTSVTSTTSSSTTSVPSGELPGEPFDDGPAPGSSLAVVGVRFDDVLYVRAIPGAKEEVIAELAPTGQATATGQARMLSKSIWYEVDADDATGWVSAHFVAEPGDTTDITSQVVGSAGGSVPMASDMVELGLAVADSVTSSMESGEGEGAVSTVMVVEPTGGDLGEVTYDVVGYPDDAVYGQRLHVFGTPGEGGGYGLKSVESTLLCRRGVSDGLCR
jgi:hypothetical protein